MKCGMRTQHMLCAFLSITTAMASTMVLALSAVELNDFACGKRATIGAESVGIRAGGLTVTTLVI
jgi:hypothetical protein